MGPTLPEPSPSPPRAASCAAQVELLVYRKQEGWAEQGFSRFEEPVTLGSFRRGVPADQVVGRCSFRPRAPITSLNATPSAAALNFTLTTAGVAIPEADGTHGTTDLSGGHNETVPCGAYGCASAELSPGNVEGVSG